MFISLNIVDCLTYNSILFNGKTKKFWKILHKFWIKLVLKFITLFSWRKIAIEIYFVQCTFNNYTSLQRLSWAKALSQKIITKLWTKHFTILTAVKKYFKVFIFFFFGDWRSKLPRLSGKYSFSPYLIDALNCQNKKQSIQNITNS